MRLLGWEIGRATERRANAENPSFSLSDPAVWQSIVQAWNSTAGVEVSTDTALGVPAVWSAVNFLSNLIASLPFHEFKRGKDGARDRQRSGMIAGMLTGTVNDDLLTSFKWRKGLMVSALTTGAGRTWIERDQLGRVINLWPLETAKTTVARENGRTRYRYNRAGGEVVYEAAEVIDITFLGAGDGVNVHNPTSRLRDTLGLAIALEQYASRFFQNGGVPPLALHTTLGSPQANARAKSDTEAAIRKANADRTNILILPLGTELKPVGVDPEKGQLTEARRFVIEQVARIFGLPPVFLQDLTHGTFTNTEQQDLHLTKHTATAWVRQIEDECNAKLYGPRQTSRFVEMDLDGLLRGDFRTRMEGNARAIQTGQLTPNEARMMDNRAPMEGGDVLLIQGATVPLVKAGEIAAEPLAPPTPNPDDEEPAANA